MAEGFGSPSAKVIIQDLSNGNHTQPQKFMDTNQNTDTNCTGKGNRSLLAMQTTYQSQCD